ncbi:immunoglobulin-like domain-containing protein [Aquipuribacter sp. SD81]|uniref:immunoglobulin-like domain-containing protein n=1 Tax=Aquipuribacter sp. SD81 TaxID=3127703 RepID=UPI003016FCA0
MTLVGSLAVVVPVTTAAGAPAEGALRDGLVAEYLFEEADGEAVRNSADGDVTAADPLDAVVRNYAAAQRSEPGTLRFTGGAKSSTGNWVELPDDLLADAQSATVSVDVRADATMLNSNHFLWNIGSESTQQYWFATTRGPRSAITTGGSGGESSGTGYAMTAAQWHSLTAVVDGEAGTITLYTDGQRSGVGTTTATPSDIAQTLSTIGRAPYNDPLFAGAVGAFRVYDRALADDEVVELSEHDAVAHADSLRAVADRTLAAVDLGDTSTLTDDIDLFELRGISWASSDPSVLAGDGDLSRPAVGEPDATVTLTATAAARGVPATAARSFTVGVPALTEADVAADGAALQVPDRALGNLYLPGQGEAGAPVRWQSSDDTVITDEVEGAAAPGVVTRPAWGGPDETVTLTATVGEGTSAVTRTFEVTVAAAPRPAVDSRYLFAYFTGDTLAGERISLAASRGNSAMTWDVLNGGQPVLSSTEGTGGLRDPFVMRSAEGDRFFMIATDLSIGSGTSWTQALDEGSTHLEIWESTDLRTWSEQRHVSVSGPFASMTWAPEAYWDEAAQEYVVYWSSRVYPDATRPYDKARTPNSTYSKVMYATTRDFVHFSDAVVWQEAGDRIDTTMIEDDGTFYRFTKEVTGCVDITQESSPSIRALTVPGEYDWTTQASCISKRARNTTRTTEGPTIFRANAGDTSLPEGVDEGFYLFVDDFTGAGYLPLFSESLADPDWRTVAGSLPTSRHGSVMPVTLEQWQSARGEEVTEVATTTTLEGLSDGAVLEGGDTLRVVVTADDGGPVAGAVQVSIGGRTLDAVLTDRDGRHVGEVVVPDDLTAGTAVPVSASYAGLAPVAASTSTTTTVAVAEDSPSVGARVQTRCVAGQVVLAVTVANTGSGSVTVSVGSAYGRRGPVRLVDGQSTSVAITTRLASVAAGSVDVRATDATGRTVTQRVGYATTSCG